MADCSFQVSNAVSHPTQISAVQLPLSLQEVETVSPPPSIWAGAVAGITHRMWQKWHYTCLRCGHVSHANTLQPPCCAKIWSSGKTWKMKRYGKRRGSHGVPEDRGSCNIRQPSWAPARMSLWITLGPAGIRWRPHDIQSKNLPAEPSQRTNV